jgi:hypothetical protein
LPAPTGTHLARSASQSFSARVHESTSSSQWPPDHPAPHVHSYAFTMSVHVLPFMHGDDSHSFGFTSQLYPAYPRAHTQLYANVWSKHVPPFRHGTDAHSSSSEKHVPTGTSE